MAQLLLAWMSAIPIWSFPANELARKPQSSRATFTTCLFLMSRSITCIPTGFFTTAISLERVSKIPPERDPEASQVEEGTVGGEQMLMTHQQAAELTEPGIGSFHDPAALVAPQFAFIFIAPLLVIGPIRRNQFDASLLQSPTQRVGVV